MPTSITSPHRGPLAGAALGFFAGLLALSLIASPARAQGDSEPPLLTLEEAIAVAMDHNRELAAAGARLDAARAGVDEARAHRRPQLDVTGLFQSTDHPVYVFSNLLSQERFSAEDFALDRLNNPAALENWKTQVELAQPLWTGGRLRHGIEAASANRDAEQASHEATRQDVVHQVVERYSAAVLARRELEVAREALATSKAHVGLIRDLHQGGLVVESDLLQAEVRESEVQELVIRAESGVEVSAAALNLAMGRPLWTAMRLPEAVGDGDGGPVGDDLDALVATAIERRPDLRSASARGAAAGHMERLARDERRPELGLVAAWEGNAESFFGTDGEAYSVSVALRYRLFDGGVRKARIGRARQEAREAGERRELLAQSVALEVRRAFYELRAATQRLDQARRGVDLAQRSLAIVEDRYREGLTILPELLDGETALTRARLREVTAHRDVLLGRASLDLATGNL